MTASHPTPAGAGQKGPLLPASQPAHQRPVSLIAEDKLWQGPVLSMVC